MYYKDGDNYLNSCVFDLFVYQERLCRDAWSFLLFMFVRWKKMI